MIKKTFIFIFIFSCFFISNIFARSISEKSIVKINSTLQNYNFLRPWEKSDIKNSKGLGTIISYNKVLVTAKIVNGATHIEIENLFNGKRISAKVTAIDYDLNLAIIEPIKDDINFFKGLIPTTLLSEVNKGDILKIFQLDNNEDSSYINVSVEKYDVEPYRITNRKILVYRVKGPLLRNNNNSSAPLFKNNKLSGLFISYYSKDQTSSILPINVIKFFLNGIKNNNYKGISELGISISETYDPVFRKFLRLQNYKGGVFINKVVKGLSANNNDILVNDVLLSLKGYSIDSRGNYIHKKYGKIHFSNIFRINSKVGDVISAKILRKGEIKNIAITLNTKESEDFFVPPYLFNRGPNYVIFGGIVFQELTMDYLREWRIKNMSYPMGLIKAYKDSENKIRSNSDRIIFISSTISNPAILGYSTLDNIIVNKLNQKSIKNIKEFYNELKKTPKNGIHTIELNSSPNYIYIDKEEAIKTDKYLSEQGIYDMNFIK